MFTTRTGAFASGGPMSPPTAFQTARAIIRAVIGSRVVSPAILSRETVATFQRAKGGLRVDGIIGPRTYVALADTLWNEPSNVQEAVNRLGNFVASRYGMPALRRAWYEYNNPRMRTGRGGSSSQSLTAGYGEYNCGSRPCIPAPAPVSPAAAAGPTLVVSSSPGAAPMTGGLSSGTYGCGSRI